MECKVNTQPNVKTVKQIELKAHSIATESIRTLLADNRLPTSITEFETNISSLWNNDKFLFEYLSRFETINYI